MYIEAMPGTLPDVLTGGGRQPVVEFFEREHVVASNPQLFAPRQVDIYANEVARDLPQLAVEPVLRIVVPCLTDAPHVEDRAVSAAIQDEALPIAETADPDDSRFQLGLSHAEALARGNGLAKHLWLGLPRTSGYARTPWQEVAKDP